MNEWGIPDWRDPAAYSAGDKWTPMRWRWEFYRRRDDLRRYFDGKADETYSHCIEMAARRGDGVRILTPSEPGFCARADEEAAFRFGYFSIPNPWISEQPSGAIFASLDYPSNVATMKGHAPRSSPESTVPVELHDGHFLVRFDVTKPLQPQLEAASRDLGEAQVARFGKKLQRRQRPHLWPTYLRVLDAREVRARWREIGEVLRLSPARPDKAVNAARTMHRQAVGMCSNFWS